MSAAPSAPETPGWDPALVEKVRAQLGRTLAGTELVIPGAAVYHGKVRDNYTLGGARFLVATDRISAFDVVLGTIPFKGQVLNRLAAWWFARTASIALNHVLEVPDPNVTLAVACQPLPVEFVVRSYLTGVTSTSIWRHYEQGARVFCGHPLPDGMQKNDRLPQPLLTPSTKADKGGHDESVSRAELLARGVISEAIFEQAAAMSMALFARGQALAAQRGLVLVDTKYEFGVDGEGRLRVIDEIHTPDSSRYWYAEGLDERIARGEEPRSLDKEYVRRWYAAQGYTGQEGTPPPPLSDEVRVEAALRYIANYELLTGERFAPDTDEPIARIRRNLHLH